ncbi:MAG: tetratricopeptide repeat protein [Myxococcota bacterium]
MNRLRAPLTSTHQIGRNPRSNRWVGFSGALLPLLAACAFSKADGKALESDVATLKVDLKEATARIQQLQQAQSDQLSRLAATVGDLNLDARRNDADFGVQVEDMRLEVARLRGAVESLDARVSELESESSKARAEFDLKIENLEEQRLIERTQSVTERQKAIAEARRQERLLSQPQASLQEARTLLDQGAPRDARKLLRELFLRNEGKRSFTRFAPAAQMLIADTYFAEGEYQQAAAEYNRVRKEYPGSSVLPAAYLSLGRCFQRLNLTEDARLFFQTVVEQYPKSRAALEARSLLKRL